MLRPCIAVCCGVSSSWEGTRMDIQTSAEATHHVSSDLKRVRDMIRSDETMAITLLVWAVDHFGFDPEARQPHVFLWHPQTIAHEIEHDVGVPIPKAGFDKLIAAIVVVTTDLFFKDVQAFI